jgi:hypothetical protein
MNMAWVIDLLTRISELKRALFLRPLLMASSELIQTNLQKDVAG